MFDNEVLQVLIVTIIPIAILELVRFFLTLREMFAWRSRVRVEATRNQFGIARTKLMDLALKGFVDPKSEVFQTLYVVHTQMLRNPSRYQELAQVMMKGLLQIKMNSKKDCAKDRTLELMAYKDALLHTAKGISILIRNLSFPRQILTGYSAFASIFENKEKKKLVHQFEEYEHSFSNLGNFSSEFDRTSNAY